MAEGSANKRPMLIYSIQTLCLGIFDKDGICLKTSCRKQYGKVCSIGKYCLRGESCNFHHGPWRHQIKYAETKVCANAKGTVIENEESCLEYIIMEREKLRFHTREKRNIIMNKKFALRKLPHFFSLNKTFFTCRTWVELRCCSTWQKPFL